MAIALGIAQAATAAVALVALLLAARVWSKDRARASERERLVDEVIGRESGALADKSRVESRESRGGDSTAKADSALIVSSPDPRLRASDSRLSPRDSVLSTLDSRLSTLAPSSAPQADPVRASAPRRVRPAHSVPGGPILIAVPDLAPAADPPEAMLEALSRRFGPIWDLADSGASAEAIARATGQPVGQVELILGLRRTRAAANRG